jgi:hypothetical protein
MTKVGESSGNKIYDTVFSDADQRYKNALSAEKSAEQEVQALLKELQGQNFVAKKGVVVNYNQKVNLGSLQEFRQQLQNQSLIRQGGRKSEIGSGPLNVALLMLAPIENAKVIQKIDATLKKLDDAKQTVAATGAVLPPLMAMKELLDAGDIEGAIMMLQKSRVQVLDEQLKGRIAALQDRNAQIKSLNDQLGDAQKALAGDKDNGDKQKRVTQLKGQIDLMNSDSQLDMIGLQSLVNKRNESFDLLSNLLNKFQKTIDGIVSNMR